ncbi:methyltransferase type 11 [Halalkaliarchaeum desulfuricum]|uniref:Methyltransferase type 11 n=1 Tax=Halalkaliarchaeum desulfuricum TaxID=2055893 RepID=A0A343TH41_9EURY|nr:class I SAM-dependent methyltransferase [Halalkaliarchaeum desulfuricum]AUX08413.1 methyltransferase type 11 [Halalkaliarchaeum desulfuricum]
MGHHTFDIDQAENLEDEGRYRYLSAEEFRSLVRPADGETLADLGSGTGFYTDLIAPDIERLYAVDVQAEMHEYYREKGLPESVETVTADVADLPVADDELDGAFSTMTYHEFVGDDALAELARVIRPGGRLVVVDWSARGDGESGPPVEEREDLSAAAGALADAGFRVTRGEERNETFLVAAIRS